MTWKQILAGVVQGSAYTLDGSAFINTYNGTAYGYALTAGNIISGESVTVGVTHDGTPANIVITAATSGTVNYTNINAQSARSVRYPRR